MRALHKEGYDIHYIGTRDGIERTLLEKEPYITYHAVSAGKLRRYFSLKNVTDAFRVVRGVSEARRILRREKPAAVFSKGGFVSVPVVLGARGRCPIVVHESDYSPGLSNRIAHRHATAICVTFEDTLARVGQKGVLTGTPIRAELYSGGAEHGFRFTGLERGKPVLLMMGGSLGAQAINDALRAALPELLKRFQVIHLCGKGKKDGACTAEGYVQYEYIEKELPHLLAMADIVLSRAGANAVFEFLALKKPALLVPLPLSASRGDQIQNANYFKKKGFAAVLPQEELTPQALTQALWELYQKRGAYIRAMESEVNRNGTEAVLAVIRKHAKGPHEKA